MPDAIALNADLCKRFWSAVYHVDDGGLSGGANERMGPKVGRLAVFLSWLMHRVRPHRGTAERISIAFSLSL